MADASSGMAVTWTVTDTQETTIGSPMGKLEKGFNVYFSTDNGLQGSVYVPETSYNPDTVSRLISQKVAAMTGIKNLSGSAGG